MSNIRVDVEYTIVDGSEIKFRSPVDCSAIAGLIVYYPGADGNTTSKVFAIADSHGNNVGDIPHLFAENVVVKVILDVTNGMAFVQNADTNAYLEAQLASKAPAGYGLGDELPTFQVNDLNSATKTGTYRYAPGSANAPTNSGEWMRTESYSSTFKHQTAFVSYVGGNVAERWMMKGVWGEWEWRNPPMTSGVEYRTTERWNGNPVYTALISYGKGPSSGTCNIPVSSVTGTNVVFVEANCKGVNGNGWGKFYNQYLSFGENGTGSAVFSLSNAGDLSDQNIYLTVKYYKV